MYYRDCENLEQSLLGKGCRCKVAKFYQGNCHQKCREYIKYIDPDELKEAIEIADEWNFRETKS
jgi:hypothetical protein